MSTLAGPQLTKWAGEVASLQEATRQGAAPTVAAFLEGAGQRDLLAQYQVKLRNNTSIHILFVREQKLIL